MASAIPVPPRSTCVHASVGGGGGIDVDHQSCPARRGRGIGIRFPAGFPVGRGITPSSLHLLVVDDDPVCWTCSAAISPGRVSKSAANGAERRALARTAIDLVLLDLGLPGEDGFELTRQLRKSWNGALVILTGRGEAVDRVVGLELGADDYVTKSFELRELLARVRSVLRRATPAAGFTMLNMWFDIAPDAMIAVDRNGAIVLASTQAGRMFGYEPAALSVPSGPSPACRGRAV